MTRHLSTEQLSSYLDGEVGPSHSERIEGHLASCPACRAELESMERLILGLHRIGRPTLPPTLAVAVRRRIATIAEPSGLFQRLQLLVSDVNLLHPAFRTSSAMVLAILFSVFLLSHGLTGEEHRAEARPVVTVKEYFGTPPFNLPPTKSEVAGLEFIWTGERWIQRGLEGKVPEAHVAAKSPEGRAMLSKYSDLELLLTEGKPVVMRYRLSTVELSGS
jgi:hypothetical protein